MSKLGSVVGDTPPARQSGERVPYGVSRLSGKAAEQGRGYAPVKPKQARMRQQRRRDV